MHTLIALHWTFKSESTLDGWMGRKGGWLPSGLDWTGLNGWIGLDWMNE